LTHRSIGVTRAERRAVMSIRWSIAGWLALGGCFPDDWNGKPYVPATTPTAPDDTGVDEPDEGLAGTWVSEGADRSPLFAAEPFQYATVVSDFDLDATYLVTLTDQEGVEYQLTGTYTTSTGTPGTVTLSQVEPYVATAEGIWQVDGDTLTYEVVQTVPDYGFTPPNPGDGFGSTSGPGMTPGLNVQTYQRR
jgi:hypothetical protein